MIIVCYGDSSIGRLVIVIIVVVAAVAIVVNCGNNVIRIVTIVAQ